jgi:hypothetical protein
MAGNAMAIWHLSNATKKCNVGVTASAIGVLWPEIIIEMSAKWRLHKLKTTAGSSWLRNKRLALCVLA